MAWKLRKKKNYVLVICSIFVIFYITLLRRFPSHDKRFQMHIGSLKEASYLAGVILNTILYIPFGYTGYIYQTKIKKYKEHGRYNILRNFFIGLVISVSCEVLQYFTKRGCADINDVLFNIIGTMVGSVVAYKIAKKQGEMRHC